MLVVRVVTLYKHPSVLRRSHVDHKLLKCRGLVRFSGIQHPHYETQDSKTAGEEDCVVHVGRCDRVHLGDLLRTVNMQTKLGGQVELLTMTRTVTIAV